MDEVEDDLDMRYHRGIKPDAYYLCPSLESLDDALRNELHKSSTSIIPVEVATEFIFAATSTITIQPEQQANLDALGFVCADLPQCLAVEHALCRDIHGKDRLKTQRAIARSITDCVQTVDGFKYIERQATNKDGTAGGWFKFVCADSFQTKKRKASGTNGDLDSERRTEYDCGGALFIKFSTQRDAINLVYKHNPIHVAKPDSCVNGNRNGHQESFRVTGHEHPQLDDATVKKKRKRRTKAEIQAANNTNQNEYPDMATSPEAITNTANQKKWKNAEETVSPVTSRNASSKTKMPNQQANPTSKSPPQQNISQETAQAVKRAKGACIRCKEKKIKCNEQRPACNQCQRGLWTCQYPEARPKKRSKTGCNNCRQRRRKCTEEKPSCAYCLKLDENCEYLNDYF